MFRSALLALSMITANISFADQDEPQICIQAQMQQAYMLMLNRERSAAKDLIENLKGRDAAFYLADFYLALNAWVEAYFEDKNERRRAGLKKVLESVAALKKRAGNQSNYEIKLAYVLAQAHAARIKFAQNQPISVLRMARSAKAQAAALLEVYPNQPDLMLVLGLYEYHSGNVPDEFKWLGKLFKIKGDKDSGLTRIKQSIERSIAFGAEAARALIQESNWRVPELCEYAGLAETLVNRAPRNAQLAIYKQGIYLHCGHPKMALSALDEFKVLNTPASDEESEVMREIKCNFSITRGR